MKRITVVCVDARLHDEIKKKAFITGMKLQNLVDALLRKALQKG